MTDGSHPQAEYFAANAGRIHRLTGRMDTLLAVGATVIERASVDDIPEVTTGELGPDDLPQYSLAATGLNPEELAEMVEDSLTVLATLSFASLRAQASLKNSLTVFNEKVAEGFSDDEALAYVQRVWPGFLTYQSATAHIQIRPVDGEGRLDLMKAQIQGLEQYDEARSYKATVSDAIAKKSMAIVLIGGQVERAHVDTTPLTDQLIERAVSIMGDNVPTKLGAVLIGSFKDEAELDAILGKVAGEYQGTSREAEVGPLLDEVRSRATSQKEFLGMGHNLTRPNQDDFEEFTELLESVE